MGTKGVTFLNSTFGCRDVNLDLQVENPKSIKTQTKPRRSGILPDLPQTKPRRSGTTLCLKPNPVGRASCPTLCLKPNPVGRASCPTLCLKPNPVGRASCPTLCLKPNPVGRASCPTLCLKPNPVGRASCPTLCRIGWARKPNLRTVDANPRLGEASQPRYHKLKQKISC